MIFNIVYLIVGITIGIILRYEFEMKAKKKKIEHRVMHMKAKASEPKIQQYDEILTSIKAINESLSYINQNKHKKKEVR